jgi:hypothetical protein
MSPKNRFMFYNLSIPSSWDYQEFKSNKERNLLVWSHIINSCIESIRIERNFNPRRVFEEILLVMKELKIAKTNKWYRNELLQSLKHELNVEINTSDFEFLKPLETKINLLKNLFKACDTKIDYMIHIIKDILNNFPTKECFCYWKDLIEKEYNKNQLDYRKIEYVSKQLLSILILNGYSINYIIDLDRSLRINDFSIILDRLTELDFQHKEFIIHIIFKGLIRYEEEKAIDAFKYDTIYVYDPKSENLPEEITLETKFLFTEKYENNLIGFRIPVKALDPISALDQSRMKIYEMLNIFAWGAKKLEEVKYSIKGETSQVLYRHPRWLKTDDLYMRKDIFIYMNKELNEIQDLGSEIYSRFSLFLRKIRQYRLSDSLEERIINLWLALESLIGEIGDRTIKNSNIIQMICPKSYIISRSYWETENILLRLEHDSPESEKFLLELAKDKGLMHFRGLRRIHLKQNYENINPLIISPYLKYRFEKFCHETNKEMIDRFKKVEKGIRTELQLLTIVRNALIHGTSLDLDLKLFCEKLEILARSTSSILLHILSKTKVSMDEGLLIMQKFYDLLLLKLDEDPNFEIDKDLDLINISD